MAAVEPGWAEREHRNSGGEGEAYITHDNLLLLCSVDKPVSLHAAEVQKLRSK